MNHFLRTWLEIQKNISNESVAVNSFMLCEALIVWSKSLGLAKDHHIKKLHDLYLSNYEVLDLSKYPMYHLGKSFKEFLSYDYINQRPKDIERAIVLTRDILWNILAFKSEKECPNCKRDKLRVLTDAFEANLYLSCDECAYTQNLKGEKIDRDAKLQPAKSNLISSSYPIKTVGLN